MKRRILSLVLCLVMGVLLVSCGGGETAAPADDTTAAKTDAASGETLEIAFIVKSVANSYWKNMFKYAEEKAESIGNVELSFMGPEAESDIEGQVAIVNDCISKGVDGIVLAACDKEALVAPVKEAKTAGIPVVLVDSGISGEDFDAFLATNNKTAGGECAKAMAEIIGDAGEVAIINVNQVAQAVVDRGAGFREEITSNHAGITVVDEYYCEGDIAKAEQLVTDAIAKYPNIKGFFAANSEASVGLINAIKKSGRTDIAVVTFDNPDEVKAGLAEGVVSATAVQMASTMAVSGVQTIVDLCEGSTVKSKNVDTGVVIVTKDNYSDADMSAILNQ